MNGDVVLVAGASGGIGRAVVNKLLARGSHVAAIGRDRERMKDALTTWSANYPSAVVDCQCIDLASPASLSEFVKFTSRYQTMSGLVVVAGSGKAGVGDLLQRHTSGQLNNVLPALMSMHACESALRATSNSSVVLISSIAGMEYLACPPEYAAAKASLHAYARHWSRSWAPVRVNIVAAGNVNSESSVWRRRLADDPQELSHMLQENVPLGRLGEPVDIALMVDFLLSESSAFVTGGTFVVDGGQTHSW
jgi:NAD(P)-dependent dehydrogenase (short-subunit alcohol dehydrogenase family)